VPSYTARHHALSTSRTARRRCGHGGCTQGHRTKPSTCRLALVPRRRRPLLSKLEAAGGFALFWLKSDASPVETDVRLSAQSSKIYSLNKYFLSFIAHNLFYNTIFFNFLRSSHSKFIIYFNYHPYFIIFHYK
jgi:hypothetical protein